MSRRLLPKQFLPLLSERSMLQDTLLRLTGLAGVVAPIVVSNNEHRFLVAEQLREIDIAPNAQILEPVGRNTAPAVAVAAMHVAASDPGGLLLVLPADHLIRDVAAFHAAVAEAARIAQAGSLVTFGIRPSEPATGYGYIERGELLAGTNGGYRVARFVEKPDRDTAAEFVATGRFSWNSGMFVLGVKQYLDELGRFRPDILDASRRAWAKRATDLDFLRLDAEAFAACPAESIDYAVMEKTGHAAVLPVDIGWSDVGSWTTLWEVGAKNREGNVTRGDVHLMDAHDCYVRAESRMVSVLGLKNAMQSFGSWIVACSPDSKEVITNYSSGVPRSKHWSRNGQNGSAFLTRSLSIPRLRGFLQL